MPIRVVSNPRAFAGYRSADVGSRRAHVIAEGVRDPKTGAINTGKYVSAMSRVANKRGNRRMGS